MVQILSKSMEKRGVVLKVRIPHKEREEVRVKRLKYALKSLGGGKNRVAKSLELMKIKGLRDDSACCPIAEYIKKSSPRCSSVDVTDVNVTVGFDDDKEYLTVKLPYAVSSFVVTFDAGGYDALVFTTKLKLLK